MTASWSCNQLTYHFSDGTTGAGAGEIVQDDTGRVEVRVQVARGLMLSNFLEPQDVKGVTTGGENVLAVGCWPVTYQTGTTHATLVFSPAEVIVSDPQHQGPWDEHRVYVKGAFWMGRPRFSDGANTVQLQLLQPNPNDPRSGVISASVNVRLATASHDSVEMILADVLELLSLAQRCPILVARLESQHQGRVVRSVLRPNAADYKARNPLIPWTPLELKKYFEQALPNYRNQSTTYDLPRLIAYYTRSFVEPIVELKFMMAGVFMEAFKFLWACNVGNLPKRTKANGLIKGFVNPTGGMYSFEDLLNQATAYLGYQTTFSFIDERNAIFHTGAAAARQLGHASVWPVLKPELIKLYRQMDDIILRILGYSGPIHPWELPDDREDFPSRTLIL